MNLREMTLGVKFAAIFWVMLPLGSCAIIQNYDNRVMSFAISYPAEKAHCEMFVRTKHLGHSEPAPPDINPATMSDEEFTDAVMTHAEKLKAYLDNDKRYLAEDIARHLETCQ